MVLQSVCHGLPAPNFCLSTNRIVPHQPVIASLAGRACYRIASKSYLVPGLKRSVENHSKNGVVLCSSNPSGGGMLELSGEKDSNSSVNRVDDDVEPNRGKSGSISFVGLTHELVEERKWGSAPFSKNKGSFLWVVAPVALIVSVLFPATLIGNAVEVFTQDQILVEILTSLISEAAFYVGLSTFLLVTDHVQRPYLQFSAKRWGLITGLRGYLSSAMFAVAFKIMAPLGAVYVTWPLLGFPALVAVAPFLVSCVAQFAFESVFDRRGSSCWHLIPIIFEVYRIYQLTKANYFIRKLMYAMNGLPTSPELLEKSGALFAMEVTVGSLSLMCLWSLVTFLLRLFPAGPGDRK